MHKRFVMNCILSAAITFAPMTLHADMVGTRTMLESETQSARMELMESFIASEEVRSQMEAMGVDPALAAERVRSLTDSQLQQLALHLQDISVNKCKSTTLLPSHWSWKVQERSSPYGRHGPKRVKLNPILSGPTVM